MTKIDLTNIEHVKEILKLHGSRAKKILGQNFLVDREALENIVEAGELSPDDEVLEIGAGLGVLTNEILEVVGNGEGKLTSLEIDTEMVPIVSTNMQNLHSEEALKNWEILRKDALKFDISEIDYSAGYKILANIPYYITSPLLRHFLKDAYLEGSITPSIIVFLMQKEVAEKITHKKKESVIGLNIKVFGEPELVAHVPAESFYPAPKVDSAVLKIKVHEKPLIDTSKIDFNKFFELIEAGFKSPRKKLHNNLTQYFSRTHGLSSEETKELLKKAEIDPNLRAEKLKIPDWERLALSI